MSQVGVGLGQVLAAAEAEAVLDEGGGGLQRVLDLGLGAVMVLALLPLMAAIALAIWLYDGGPVFFGHSRVGLMGKSFRCWKFRSMAVDADAILEQHLAKDPAAQAEWEADHKLRDDPRVTLVGRFLRRTSLDELPQLWNVLLGEMSLVGPRPIVVTEIARYQSSFQDYCSCRPGITGLWQVSGRNDTSYQRRVALDVEFARTRSVGLYFVIIVSTVPAVIARRGAY